jgi:hypothetical protein
LGDLYEDAEDSFGFGWRSMIRFSQASNPVITLRVLFYVLEPLVIDHLQPYLVKYLPPFDKLVYGSWLAGNIRKN